jgi:hypothetical protein
MLAAVPGAWAARPATSVSTPTVTVSPSAAAHAASSYAVTFKTSAKGGLSQSASSTVTVVYPAGTDVSNTRNQTLTDQTTNQQVGYLGPVNGTTLTYQLFGGSSTSAGDTLVARVGGVVNPGTGSYQVKVSTSADATQVSSASYSIVSGHSISAPTVSVTTTTAAHAASSYAVTFKTSATGGLSQVAASTVTVVYPAGTDVSHTTNQVLTDETTNQSVGYLGPVNGTTLTYQLYGGSSTNAGDTLVATVGGVVNPGVGTYQVKVSTSSDLPVVTSASYSIVAGHSISTPTVAVTTTTAAHSASSYSVTFKTSSTGGLSQVAGSTVTVVYPAGTDVSHTTNQLLTDVTKNQNVGYLGPVNGTTLTYQLYGGSSTNAGDTLVASAGGIVNPAAGTYQVKVSTSSDVAVVTSASYTIGAGHSISTPTVSVTTTSAAGGTASYAVTFKTSSTGGLSQAAGSTVTVVYPAGTDVSHTTNQLLTDVTKNQNVGYLGPVNGTTLTYQLYGGSSTNAGDTLVATAGGVVNPTSGTYQVKVSTSGDLPVVTSSKYSIVPAQSISVPMVTPSSHAPGGTKVSYAVTFKTSSTGGLSQLAGSIVSLTYPPGTTVNSPGGVVTDSTTQAQVGYFNRTVGTTAIYTLYGGDSVKAGDSLQVTTTGVGNPAAGSDDTVKVSTSSDMGVTSCPFYVGKAPAGPCVLTVTPVSGPAGGRSTIKVGGINLAGATAVKFGNGAASHIVVAGSTSLTVSSPAGSGSVNVTVHTAAGTSPVNPYDAFVYIPPPYVRTISLPNGTVKVPYNANLAAKSGRGPYKWAISVGALPPGLKLTATTGVVAGTPTTAGTYKFTVEVTDSESPPASGSKVFTIVVAAPPKK